MPLTTAQLSGPSSAAPSALGSRILLTGTTYGVLPGGSGTYLAKVGVLPEPRAALSVRSQALTAGAAMYARSLLTGTTYGVTHESGRLLTALSGVAAAPDQGVVVTDSILSAVTFGTATVTLLLQFITSAGGVASGSTFGTAVVELLLQFVTGAGAISSTSIGSPTVTPGAVSITVPSISAASAVVGEPAVNGIHIDVDFEITSTVSFGLASVTAGISDAGGIDSTASFGTGVVVLDSTTRPFSIFVGGVDVTKYIKFPSINVRADLNSRASAQFTVIPEMRGRNILSTWRPGVRDEVVIVYTRGGIWRLFSGFVADTEEEILNGLGGYFEINVSCTDYAAIADYRIVARWYDLFHGGVAGIFAEDVIQSFLDGTGITYAYEPGGADASIGNDNLINYLTASEAFNQIASKANIAWRIDWYGTFRWMAKGTGYEAAPFAIADADGNWRSMKVRESKSEFWNVAIVRNSQGITAMQTDEYEATAALVIPTEYPLDVKPAILVDGTEADDSLVVEMGDRASTPGWEWYYIAGGIGVFPASAVTGTVQVIYPSRLSYVARAQDDASIASVGRWEHLEEAKDVTDPDDLQDYADAVLQAGLTVPKILDIETDRPGLEPGQLLSVNVSNATGDFLVESVVIEQIPGSEFYIRYQVQASNAPQRRSGAAFFQRLMTQARQAVDRVDSGIAFTLAETIPGIENPGLEVDADSGQQAFRTARKGGYLRIATLKFKSIEDGTLTSADIEVDVLKNGVSIFPTGAHLKIRAGSTQPAQRFRFSTNPYPVSAGDVFTYSVISADSSAHDGFLELQVMG